MADNEVVPSSNASAPHEEPAHELDQELVERVGRPQQDLAADLRRAGQGVGRQREHGEHQRHDQAECLRPLQQLAPVEPVGVSTADRAQDEQRDSLAGTTTNGEKVEPRPTALIVTTLDGLLDRDRTPGWLLHTMAGGRMRATTRLINRMVDERGADLRLLVFDDHGTAIGVGHKTKVPPGWLRETVWAQHLADQAPGSTTPVRRCDLDHIIPWPDGPTDATNLQPVGRTAHNAKTNKHAVVARTRHGTTAWTDRHTALTVRRPPAWRPLDADPPDLGPPKVPINTYDTVDPP
ncbi:MAG: HNH endonuclease [Proteobacteria bacterium]|nr:HNH endonuclease [Pseudomonadota bacterium]